MPLHPQAKALLEAMAAQAGSGPPPTLEQRRAATSRPNPLGGPPEPVAKVVDRRIPGPAGEIPVRVYTPEGRPPFPALVYFHGGGWRMGSLESVDAMCRVLANRAGCVVVSVDYRLAPENKFPAALEDAYAATRWVAEHGAEIEADPSRIAVGGDSAGGNLAAVVPLAARERGGPRLAFQLLMCPCTGPDVDTPSWRENSGYLMTLDSGREMIDMYVKDEADRRNPLFAPLLAEDLRGLPPAYMIVAEYDPLRDEDRAYAARLREAGVPVEERFYEGMVHNFMQFGAAIDRAKEALDDAGAALRAAFARPG